MILNNLNPRERNLALLLAATGFILLNLLFLPRLTAANKAGRSKNTELQAQLTAAEGWIAKQDYWDARKKWLAESQPELTGARGDTATQLEKLQQAAKDFGLKLDDIQLLQLEETEFYHPVGVRLTATGPWPGLVKFVARLQGPRDFDVIPRFSIKSAAEPPDVQAELEVQRWFRKNPEGATP